MLTSPTLLAATQTTGQSQGNSLSQLGEDYQSFLTLLTAQLTNQDPLSPVDSTDFVAQLAQLSQVEQAVQTNDRIETLTDQVAGLLNLNGTQLIGREVKSVSNLLWLEDGQTNSTYVVAEGAVEVQARITDPLGRTVRTLSGLSADPSKENPLVWDGRDTDGVPQLEGAYTVELIARDAAGELVGTEVSRTADVEEVIFQEGEILFKLDGGELVSSVTVSSAK